MQGAGCASCARPDLWGAGKSDPPRLPDEHDMFCVSKKRVALGRALSFRGLPDTGLLPLVPGCWFYKKHLLFVFPASSGQ